MKDLALQACRHLLIPIVRMLLRAGVPWADFAATSKEVYVDVARRDFGVAGRLTNLARVSMLTGLSRREASRVKKIVEDQLPQPASSESHISRILTGWHLDDDFLDDRGEPALLPASGAHGSLEALLKRYAGDLPHGAVVKELLRLDLIAQDGTGNYKVLARDFVRTNQDPAIVRQMAVALHDHGATLAHNVNQERTKPARFEGMATNARVNRRYSRNFEKLIAERGASFLEEIDKWLSGHEVPADSTASHGHTRMGVGVYLIYDDEGKRS